ncbi:MAG: hypothetical protein LBJ63_10380 [Prevotellaceae bacterium]|nr:hypothetical protein [Prevotellaceae bacterium]
MICGRGKTSVRMRQMLRAHRAEAGCASAKTSVRMEILPRPHESATALFGAGKACAVLKAKLRFAASLPTCFYLLRSGSLCRTEGCKR